MHLTLASTNSFKGLYNYSAYYILFVQPITIRMLLEFKTCILKQFKFS